MRHAVAVVSQVMLLLCMPCCFAAPDAIGSIHLLPIYPSTGDRGFGPVTYEDTDPELGVLHAAM